MEFIFLGTSSGIPTLQRNVSGLVVKRQNSRSWCLVDCGEGTQHQLLRLPYSLAKLSCIFITHVHGDHCYGLPGLLATATMAGRTQPLTIVAPAGIKTYVEECMRVTDVRMSYELNFVDVAEGQATLLQNEFAVSSCLLSHRVPSYAYLFKEVAIKAKLDIEKLVQDGIPRGELWGQIAHGDNLLLPDGRNIQAQDYLLAPQSPMHAVVGGDNDTPSLLANVAPSIDVLIHEATYTQEVADKVGPGPQHSSARSVAEFARDAGVKNLVLTHFSARYHHPHQASDGAIGDIEAEARKYYLGQLFLAEDFAHFSLSDGVLSRVPTRGLRTGGFR